MGQLPGLNLGDIYFGISPRKSARLRRGRRSRRMLSAMSSHLATLSWPTKVTLSLGAILNGILPKNRAPKIASPVRRAKQVTATCT
eukprot:scaffold81_cov115-Isochrysis_galbana.AAC.6